jgi:hypothetical protein
MTRRQRQLDELRALCGAGRVGRAVDLAFEHFSSFGRDEAVIDLLDEATDAVAVPQEVRRRFTELDGGPAAAQGTRPPRAAAPHRQ